MKQTMGTFVVSGALLFVPSFAQGNSVLGSGANFGVALAAMSVGAAVSERCVEIDVRAAQPTDSITLGNCS